MHWVLQQFYLHASAFASTRPRLVASSLLKGEQDATRLADMQVHERADVEKAQNELAASKATLANAIAEARELEHKVCVCSAFSPLDALSNLSYEGIPCLCTYSQRINLQLRHATRLPSTSFACCMPFQA